MDGRTRLAKIKKVFSNTYKQNLSLNELKAIIRMEIASDENRIAEILRLMTDCGLIRETSPFHFKISQKASNAK